MQSSVGRKWAQRLGAWALLPLVVGLLQGCSSDDEEGIARPPDSIPPARVALGILNVSATTIELSWQAPGNDGMYGEPAAAYELRHSNTELTAENFSLATAVAGVPAPGDARSRERLTIENLTAGETYFFAIRTRDGTGNWAPLSAVINFSMPPVTGFPLLREGYLLTDEGTVTTSFVFRVMARAGDEDTDVEDLEPEIVIGTDAHAMRLISVSQSGDALFEFAANLDIGEYDHYFRLADETGLEVHLPSPGTWTGPKVVGEEHYSIDFIEAPAGGLMMGNPDPNATQTERPLHEVTLTHPFYFGRYEITNAQYCRALTWALSQELITVSADFTRVFHVASENLLLVMAPREEEVPHGIRCTPEGGFTPVEFRENWPATYVTWYGAAFYCNVLSWWEGLAPAYNTETWGNIPNQRPYEAAGWRLLTEAEWEYLAHYNDGRLYPTGELPPRPGIDGNFGGVIGHPTPVGSYPDGANALGALDLIGNVYEWCNDWRGAYAGGSQVDPPGVSSGSSRVVRGGSWGSGTDELRAYFRYGLRPGNARDGLGFRCARTVPEAH